MLRTRVMPCLLLDNGGLVKTIKFKAPTYIGDPINSVRIYNELEVNELIFLDIHASVRTQEPPYRIIEEIATECFMPFSYGGGIKTLAQAKKLFKLGVEKIVLNTSAITNPLLIREVSEIYGSQSVVVSIDYKKDLFGKYRVFKSNGRINCRISPVEHAINVEKLGAGEILLNSIDADGVMNGFNLDIIEEISKTVKVPVVALGGAGNIDDILKAKNCGASAVALGSMAVYQNKNRGILINFPSEIQIKALLDEE